MEAPTTSLEPARPSPSARPLFSILTPAFCAERWIAGTIESVRAQTLTDWELLVCDNGSTDATAARIAPYLADPRIRLVVSEHNRPPAAVRNELAAATRGRYIVMLDADDRLLPAFCARAAAVFAERSDVAVVSPDALLVRGNGEELMRSTMMSTRWWRAPRRRRRGLLVRQLLRRVFVYPGAATRRDVFEQLGGLDEDLYGCVDWDLWIRAAVAGWDIALVDEPLAVYRVHSGSLSRPGSDATTARFLENVALMLSRMAAWEALSRRERATARRSLARVRRHALMAHARQALVDRDTPAARRLAFTALRTGRDPRSVAVALGLSVLPRSMQALHARRLRIAREAGTVIGFRDS